MSSRPSQFVFTQPGPLRMYSTVELLRLPPPTYLVDKVLPEGGMIGIYGAPGHGKSFVALDLALCVATGLPWKGHAVQQGFVVYVSAEGGAGIGKRVGTWLAEHHIDPKTADIAWITESIVVGEDTESMTRLFSRLETEIDKAPALFIIDTVARCFDGDENKQEDMGSFVRGIDAMRLGFKSTVIAVHHTRQGEDRERGSTAFRGAADTMIFVRKDSTDGCVCVSCNKQKDDEEFPEKRLTLKVNPLFNSCTLVSTDTNADDIVTAAIVSAGKAGISFSGLQEMVVAEGSVSAATMKRRLKKGLVDGAYVRADGLYRMASAK
jgi:hypothetical protein